jgi:hypothetical protein
MGGVIDVHELIADAPFLEKAHRLSGILVFPGSENLNIHRMTSRA